MICDTLSEHLRAIHRIEASYTTQKLVGTADGTLIHAESWFDDQYVTGYGPEYEIQIDESWLDDLDENA